MDPSRELPRRHMLRDGRGSNVKVIELNTDLCINRGEDSVYVYCIIFSQLYKQDVTAM